MFYIQVELKLETSMKNVTFQVAYMEFKIWELNITNDSEEYLKF